MAKTDFTKPTERFRPDKAELDGWNGDIDALSGADDLDSVMRTLACIVGHYDEMKMDHLQCVTYHKALDWLLSLKTRLEAANEALGAIRIIEYTTGCANSDGEMVEGTETTRHMVYNTHVISEEDAEKVLRDNRQNLDPRVVDLWPSEAEALFPNLHRTEDDEDDTTERAGGR